MGEQQQQQQRSTVQPSLKQLVAAGFLLKLVAIDLMRASLLYLG